MTKSNRIFSGLLEYQALWRYKEHNRFSKQMGFNFMALELKHGFPMVIIDGPLEILWFHNFSQKLENLVSTKILKS